MQPELQDAGTANQRASGYFHSYLKTHDIDLTELSKFPSNPEIQSAIDTAFQEAHSLWSRLGYIFPTQSVTLPPISTLFNVAETGERMRAVEAAKQRYLDFLASLQDDPHTSEDEAEEVVEEAYGQLMDNIQVHRTSNEDIFKSVVFASISVDMDRLEQIRGLPEEPETFSDTGKWIGDLLADALPPLLKAPHQTSPSSRTDMSGQMMLSLRFKHQTREALVGGRRRSNERSVKLRTHHQLLVKLNDVLRARRTLDEEAAAGKQRKMRWTEGKSGNASNATVVKQMSSEKQLIRRVQVFEKFAPQVCSLVGEASLSLLLPLSPGMFGLCLVDSTILLAKVITFYSRSAGKNGAHAWVPEIHPITQASNIVVQLFWLQRGPSNDISTHRARWNLFEQQVEGNYRFALVQSSNFVCAIQSPIISGDDKVLRGLLHHSFVQVLSHAPRLQSAVTELKKRKMRGKAGEKKKAAEEAEDNDEEDDRDDAIDSDG